MSATHSGPCTELEVLGLDNAMLAVGDLELAVEFYTGKLGLTLRFEVPDRGIAGFRLGSEEPGLVVHVRPIHAHAPHETPRIWLEVRDARVAASELQARGVNLLDEPFEVATGWTVEFADPWGNVIGLTDYTKDPGRGRSAQRGRLRGDS